MFPCEWTRIAPWTLSNCCSLFMPASPFLVLYSVFPVLFSLLCILCSVPSPLRFIILSFLPKWKLMNVGKCFWQCARRRQHTEDSKLNVICQVASSSLSLFCKWVCVYVGTSTRSCACVCVSECAYVTLFFVLFHFQLLFVFALSCKFSSVVRQLCPLLSFLFVPLVLFAYLHRILIWLA